MSLHSYLLGKGFTDFEGFSQQLPQQVEDLGKCVSNDSIKTMLEIGFNAGHSAEVFLATNPNIHLTSYDLKAHDYTATGKEFIDLAYPGRHTIIYGDSMITVREDKNTYDAFFIDGGHDYKCANADVRNCYKLANHGSLVIVDDVVSPINQREWTEGPSRVWNEVLEEGLVKQIFAREYAPGRGMVVGYYQKK